MKSLKWLSVGLAALLLAPVAWAQRGMPEQMEKGAGMKEGMGKGMALRLELTEDQQKQIDAIRAERQEAMKPLREKLAAQMKELKVLVDKKAGDREISKALDGIKDTRDKMQSTARKYGEKHDAVLTPTQRAKATLGMGKGMKERAKRRANTPKECPYNKAGKKAD